MQLFIIFAALVLEAPPDNLLVGIPPYGIYVITACPEPAAPEQLFHLRAQTENFLRRDNLHRPDYFLRGVTRDTPNQKMDMLPVKADLKKMNLVTLLDLKTDLPEGLRYRIAQKFSTIFDRANKMVQKQAFVVTLVDMLDHSHKYRGYLYATPEESLGEF